MERAASMCGGVSLGMLSILSSALLFSPVSARAQVTVSADGPGHTYELLEARGFGLETPDCGHPPRHVREVFDSTLGTYVFAFDSHRDVDSDRCTNFDRQRMEVKTAPGRTNHSTLRHAYGDTAYYRWKFKLPRGFRPSPNFTHIFQIKAHTGPDAGAPILTFTPRAGNPDQLQIIFTAPSGQPGSGVQAQADLSSFRDEWVEAFVRYLSADVGDIEVSLTRLSDGATLLSWYSGTVDTWRDGDDYNRGKWGIYRSLNSISYLRDETVRFADWCVSETNASECPSAAASRASIALSRTEAESDTKVQGAP